jgi:hypothetical protein
MPAGVVSGQQATTCADRQCEGCRLNQQYDEDPLLLGTGDPDDLADEYAQGVICLPELERRAAALRRKR